MAGVSTKVTVTGAIKVLKAIGKMGSGKPSAPAPLLDQIGVTVVRFVKRTFVNSEDPMTRKKWDPPKGRPGGQPLRDTGRLMRSITYERHGGSVHVGTNVLYAATQNFGDKNRKSKTPGKRLAFMFDGQLVRPLAVVIPQRRFMPENPLPHELQGEISRRIDKWYGDTWK